MGLTAIGVDMPTTGDEVPDRAETDRTAPAAQNPLYPLPGTLTATQLAQLSKLLLLGVASQVSYEEAVAVAASHYSVHAWDYEKNYTERSELVVDAKVSIATTLIEACLGGE